VQEVDIVFAQAFRVLDDILDKVCTLLLVEGADEVHKRYDVLIARSTLATFDTPVLEAVVDIVFLHIVSAARHDNLDVPVGTKSEHFFAQVLLATELVEAVEDEQKALVLVVSEHTLDSIFDLLQEHAPAPLEDLPVVLIKLDDLELEVERLRFLAERARQLNREEALASTTVPQEQEHLLLAFGREVSAES
jgi:hypothetical protein